MRIPIFSLVFIAGIASHLCAQQEGVPSWEDTVAVYEDLFSAEEPIHLTLKFDVKALTKTRRKDVYHHCRIDQCGAVMTFR